MEKRIRYRNRIKLAELLYPEAPNVTIGKNGSYANTGLPGADPRAKSNIQSI